MIKILSDARIKQKQCNKCWTTISFEIEDIQNESSIHEEGYITYGYNYVECPNCKGKIIINFGPPNNYTVK